jgi:ribose transport system permease protein
VLRRYGKELGIFFLLVVLCVFLASMNPRFLSPINLQNTARLIGMYGIFSLGIGFVIITGGIDLSVGSMIALLGVLLSIVLVDFGWNPVLGLGVVVVVGAFLGTVHAGLITRARLQPFIVTLCGLLIYRGLARYVARDETKGFGAESFGGLKDLATGTLLGVPTPFWLLIFIAVILWVVLHRSVYGRYLYAIGRNEEAARFSGVKTKRIEAGAYVLAGVLTAISAVLFAFYTNSVSPSTHGNFYELYGIAAAVLGGCSLRGGEGSVIGILLGVALLQVLQNLVNLLGIPSSLNFAVMGTVILVGVLVDSVVRGRQPAA